MFSPAFDFMFTLVPLIIFAAFIFILVQGLRTWSHNNAQPVLTVQAKVVSKRQNVSHHMDSNSDGIGSHSHTDTSYHITFEVESGDRLEFIVNGSEYGLLVEGDYGRLTFQGTRYKGFIRIMDN